MIVALRALLVGAILLPVASQSGCERNQTYVLREQPITLDSAWVRLPATEPMSARGDDRSLRLRLPSHYAVGGRLEWITDNQLRDTIRISARLVLADGRRVALECCGAGRRVPEVEVFLWIPSTVRVYESAISAVEIRSSRPFVVNHIAWLDHWAGP